MICSIILIITSNFFFKFSSYNILVNVPKYKEKIISVYTVLSIKLTLLSDVLIMSDLCCHCPTHLRMRTHRHTHTHTNTNKHAILEAVVMTDMRHIP